MFNEPRDPKLIMHVFIYSRYAVFLWMFHFHKPYKNKTYNACVCIQPASKWDIYSQIPP